MVILKSQSVAGNTQCKTKMWIEGDFSCNKELELI